MPNTLVRENKTRKVKEVKKFESKYGYFTEDGREYVITRPDTPRPWSNVICNGDYGFTVTQTGAGFSWRDNSNLSRITRWDQDLVKDNWGKFIYVRDNDSGEYWSETWKPMRPNFDTYEVRHGQGYSVLKSSLNGIATEKTVFVDVKDPVEVWKLQVTNESSKKRSVSLFSYFEWCLGNAADTHREFQKTFIETQIDKKNRVIYGKKRPALIPGFISTGLTEAPLEGFHSVNVQPAGYEGYSENFFGHYGDHMEPAVVRDGVSTNSEGKWGDSMASLRVDLDLNPGQSKTVVFVLGVNKTRKEAHRILKKYETVAGADKELEKVKALWDSIINASTIETPDESMNFMTNVWMRYQAISARLWARCGYYQSSGGFGYRDQLQDCQIFFSTKPELAKKQILMHAEQQFPDGTVYHWWHHGTGMGAITECSDDLLWLPFITLNYLDETADDAIWDTKVNFLPDPKTKKVTKGTLYDHCQRSIEKALARFSKRGLPLIGECDWNDGLSHLGVKMKGESIWLSHFLYGIMTRMVEVCERKRDKKRASKYKARAKKLKDTVNKLAWDGGWYWRATSDEGQILGRKNCKEGKIFLNAQTWAVINGMATPERAKKAMDNVAKYLYKDFGPLLFTPAFSVTNPKIGYITRYAPAIRENGGLYTHAGTWAIQAECMMRNADKAYQVYKSFNPALRGDDPDNYYAEPYVTPGNVDGPDSPNFGRGGWTWYTGSAAWYSVIVMNWMLGVRPTREGLLIDPVVPKSWKHYKIKRLFRGSTYNVEVKNQGKGQGVKEITVNGKKLDSNLIPTSKTKKTFQVKVIVG